MGNCTQNWSFTDLLRNWWMFIQIRQCAVCLLYFWLYFRDPISTLNNDNKRSKEQRFLGCIVHTHCLPIRSSRSSSLPLMNSSPWHRKYRVSTSQHSVSFDGYSLLERVVLWIGMMCWFWCGSANVPRGCALKMVIFTEALSRWFESNSVPIIL